MINRSPFPIIELWGCLVVPLTGDMTDEQAVQLTSAVLERIRRRGSRSLVIDLSGLWMVDSHLCAALAHLAAAAALMGTEAVICGLTPEVTLTLQAMGVDLNGVRTAISLEQALEVLGAAPGGRSSEWGADLPEELLDAPVRAPEDEQR